MEATEGISHPKGGAGLDGCETKEIPAICNVCQQMADEKESGQGRDRTGDTRIFSPLLYLLSYLTISWNVLAIGLFVNSVCRVCQHPSYQVPLSCAFRVSISTKMFKSQAFFMRDVLSTFPRFFRYATAFLGIFLCSIPIAAAEKYDPSHPVVMEMVRKGVAYLSSSQSSNGGEGILAALAIYKADVNSSPDHPRVKAGINIARGMADRAARGFNWEHDSMYSLPLAGMLLASVNPVEYANDIKAIRDALVNVQRPNGGFGYMSENAHRAAGQGDISQIQYVMLFFWTLTQADIDVPQDSLKRCITFLMSAQLNDGGWPYQSPDTAGTATHSLAAAGFSGFLIAGDALGLYRSKWAENQEEEGIVPTAFQRIVADEKRKKPAMDRAQLDSTIKKAENYFSARPYTRSTWHYYYLYGKERYESFLEITKGKRSKSPDWYNEAVELFMTNQAADGSWGSSGKDSDSPLAPDVCTSFAILFLIRNTQKAIGELHDDVLFGGQGLPDDPSSVVVKNGKLMNKTATTNIDDALKMLESDGKAEGEDSLIPEQMSLPKDPKVRKDQLNRFSRLLNSQDPKARRFAAKILGRGDDLDFVPALIYALSDPDSQVPRFAEASLRLISRQLDTYHLPREGKIGEGARVTAVLQWRKWYLTVRPDYVFVD